MLPKNHGCNISRFRRGWVRGETNSIVCNLLGSHQSFLQVFVVHLRERHVLAESSWTRAGVRKSKSIIKLTMCSQSMSLTAHGLRPDKYKIRSSATKLVARILTDRFHVAAWKRLPLINNLNLSTNVLNVEHMPSIIHDRATSPAATEQSRFFPSVYFSSWFWFVCFETLSEPSLLFPAAKLRCSLITAARDFALACTDSRCRWSVWHCIHVLCLNSKLRCDHMHV